MGAGSGWEVCSKIGNGCESKDLTEALSFSKGKSMRKSVVCFVAVLMFTAVASFGCTQRCRYSGGGSECETVGYVTNMSCYMNGPSCIDVQEYGCWVPKEETATETLAQQIGIDNVNAAPICAE